MKYCRYKGIPCEIATEYGYCQITVCVRGDKMRYCRIKGKLCVFATEYGYCSFTACREVTT